MSNYQPVQWNEGDDITDEKLNQMAQNDEYFFKNTPLIHYKFNGSSAPARQKRIFATNFHVPASGSHLGGQTWVDFDGFFTPGCKPIINVTLAYARRSHYYVQTINDGGNAPNVWSDHNGATILVSADMSWYGSMGLDAYGYLIAIGY